MSKHTEKIKALYKENKKSSLIWYLVLRAFVILTMITSFIRKDFSSVFLCGLTLILFLIYINLINLNFLHFHFANFSHLMKLIRFLMVCSH